MTKILKRICTVIIIISLGTLLGCSSNEKANQAKQEDKLVEIPSIPLLSLPGLDTSRGSKVIDLTPTLSWEASNGAEYYEVGLSMYSNGSYQIIYEENIYAASITLPSEKLFYGNEYRWNVRAYNAKGASEWSSRLYFYTEELINSSLDEQDKIRCV